MRRLVYLLPMVIFLVVAGYFALALRPGYDPQVLPSAMIDKEAPTFDLAGLNGGAVSLVSLKGGPVIINFFASWCVPCREEQPVLMRLAKHDHVALYGIDYKDAPQDARRLLAEYGDPYRKIGMDTDGTVGLNFGVYGVPETYVLDSTGHIRRRFVGPLTAAQVNNELLPLMKTLGAS
jgi:cytochrome c biogenesis protein CcmG, thiol:disulfide interchange protein DsbE